MADYSGKIASAQAAIMAKGMPVVYVTVEKSDQYDPVTGTYPTVESAASALCGESYVACGSITLAGELAGLFR